MPACPVCRDDFEDDVRVCPVDGEVLLPRDQLPPPPVGDAQLGLFHPTVVLLVQRWLGANQTGFRTIEVDARRVELRVPADVRDDLRAALTLHWPDFVRALEPAAREQLVDDGATGDHPGWLDPPRGAWIDDDGRLRVEAGPEEEDGQDASRTIGPALVIVGVVVLLLAWGTGFDAGAVLLGGSAIVLGLLLPR